MKTAIFVILALAALGAVGVTTAFMSSATVAHAAPCTLNAHVFVCPPDGANGGGFVCNQQGCRDTGRPS